MSDFKMTPEEWLLAKRSYDVTLEEIIERHGDRICDYRCAIPEEEIVSRNSGIAITATVPTCVPVFILRPRKKITVTDYVFKATGETRVPKAGDWYKSCSFGRTQNVFTRAHFNNLYSVPKEIYTREEITREIEVDE